MVELRATEPGYRPEGRSGTSPAKRSRRRALPPPDEVGAAFQGGSFCFARIEGQLSQFSVNSRQTSRFSRNVSFSCPFAAVFIAKPGRQLLRTLLRPNCPDCWFCAKGRLSSARRRCVVVAGSGSAELKDSYKKRAPKN